MNTTYDTTTDTAEKIIAKYHDMTWRSEIATSMLCNHAKRDPHGNSKEAQAWQKARVRQELLQSIRADMADAGIVLPEWPERS